MLSGSPRALALALLLALPAAARGQATPHLQPLDPVHADLERLAAWGLVDGILIGHRPYSRLQAARWTAEAASARDRLEDEPALAATAAVVLERLSAALAPELIGLGVPAGPVSGVPLLSGARLDARWTDSPSRSVPSNRIATIDAGLNPLLAYDLGRERVEGASAGIELELSAGLGGRIAGTLRPRAHLALPAGGDFESGVTLQSGHARLLLGNAALTLGRDHVVWGQGPRGGLALSANPGALLLVSLATERPVRLPWLLGRLGPSLHQLFLADLGEEAQRFPHSQLFGWRSSFLPHPHLELGVQFLVESGGEGAPEASLADRVLDYLFFPDLFSNREFLFSNKLAGFDARVRVPRARGLELYVEGVIDDIDIDRFRSMLWEDGSWTAGVRLARVDDAGTVGLRVEGQHTGLRFYEHGDFTSGLTLNRRILGSELGPNGNGVTVTVDWEPDSRHAFFVEGAVERRSNDDYLLIIGSPFYFVRTAIRPKEVRWRALAGWQQRRWSPGAWRFRLEGGYEYVDHFGFAAEGTRHNLMVRSVVEVGLR